jgi:hypothetical protein
LTYDLGLPVISASAGLAQVATFMNNINFPFKYDLAAAFVKQVAFF